MQLIDFIDTCNICSKTGAEVFGLLCYYMYKENGKISFSVKKMLPVYDEAGLPRPDISVIRKEVTRNNMFRPYGLEGTLKLSKDTLRSMEKDHGHLWDVASVNKSAKDVKITVVRPDDFADACDMPSKDDNEIFELLCYYLFKEKGTERFHFRKMEDVYKDAELPAPERNNLKKMAYDHGSFRRAGLEWAIAFVPEALGPLEDRYGHMWDSVPETSERTAPVSYIIDETKFCGKRDGFDRLIIQINSAYRGGHHDSCALLMRRLLEASVILAFQTNGMEKDIVGSGGRYLCLDEIIQNAAGSDVPGIPLKDVHDVSTIGDYSEKGWAYTFSINDINSVRLAYRNVLERLFTVSKLL